MAPRVEAEKLSGMADRLRLLARLVALVSLALLLAAAPLRTPHLDPVGGAHHRHAHAGHEAKPSDPERPEHGGCHFCRLGDVALPPPQVLVIPPLRDFALLWGAAADQPVGASPRLTRPYVRAPPRRA